MKARLITFFIALAALSSLNANATVKSYSLKVNDFSQLKVVDGVNVEYRCSPDSAGLITFECEPDVASFILFEPSKKKLSIKLSNEYTPRHKLPTVIVYSSSLSKIENSGDSTVVATCNSRVDKLSAKIIGNGSLTVRGIDAEEVAGKIETGKGSMTLQGECTKAVLSSTGKGHIQAEGLSAIDGKCSIWGVGSIGCNVRNRLNIVGLGSGTIFYRTNPREIINNSAGLKLEHLGN